MNKKLNLDNVTFYMNDNKYKNIYASEVDLNNSFMIVGEKNKISHV
jgi:hypothetical protein